MGCDDTAIGPITLCEKSLQRSPIQQASGYELCYTELR
jgi:hypothetical protein